MTFDPTQAFIRHQGCDVAMVAEPAARAGWYVCPACGSEFEGPRAGAGNASVNAARRDAKRTRSLGDIGALVAILVLVVAFLTVLACPPVFAQGRVFYEPGDGSSKAATDCVPTTAARDGVAHRGGVALECNWDGTLGWQDSAKTRELELDAVPMTSELFADAWFRVDADVDNVAGSKLMRFSYGAADVIIACQFEQAEPTLFMSVGGQSSFWGGTAASRCRQGWQRIRVYMSRTLIRLWLGDALLREWSGSFNVNGMVAFMSNWSDNAGWKHDSANHVYWSGAQIFSDRGTGGTGSMRDGTMTQGGSQPPPPHAPVDCAGTWGSWTRNADSDSACSATGTRTFTESRLFTVSRPASNGGAACPASPETRTVTENCQPPVQSVTYTCWVTSSPAGYADGDARRYIRCDTNGPVTSLPNGTTFTISVPKK